MEFGKNLVNLRKKHNLSQEELAEKVGVARQTISKWELGETSPDLMQAMELAKIFKVSLDELVNNDIKDILVDKISNTEKLAGMIIKILRVLGVLLIIALIGFVLIFSSFKYFEAKPMSNAVSESVGIYCEINGNKEYFEATTNRDNPDLLEFRSSNELSLKDMGLNILDYKDINRLIKDVEKYVNSHGGDCN